MRENVGDSPPLTALILVDCTRPLLYTAHCGCATSASPNLDSWHSFPPAALLLVWCGPAGHSTPLVSKGFSQVEGVDYHQIFSPVIQFETMQCMFALTTLEGWHISGLNVWSTYLYGKLDEELYMKFPEGFLPPNMKGKVLRLLHAIYGLKQAGLAWWHVLDKSMQELGFEQLKSDASLFVYKWGNDIVLTIIYVDNALFCSPSKSLVEKIKAAFMKKWECWDLVNEHNWEGHCIQYILTSGITSTKYLSTAEWSMLSLLVHPFLRNTTQRRTMPPLNLKCEHTFKWSLSHYFT